MAPRDPMALISDESLERVKQAADIVEVVSAHTDLRRQGARWVGLCPFHEERTPSFSVDAAGEALPLLRLRGRAATRSSSSRRRRGSASPRRSSCWPSATGSSCEREQEDPRAEARRQQRRRLGELLDRTAGFYADYLWDSDGGGQGARSTWPSAGWARRCCAPSASATRRAPGTRCCCGASGPASRSTSCARSGWSSGGGAGGEYDRFRSRIMFPIRDRRGRTLGFGGRAMRSDQGAKYVNTAETDFFHKSQMLYGIDLAKAAIAKAGRAVVVEGYTDVLALHQAGVEEAVGVMGTAITEEQVAALSGMVEEVVLALDADSAGPGGDAAGAAGRGRDGGCGCGSRRCRPARTRRR